MQNYFNYFTEIEQKFQQRRGSLLMLSTLDWALIETWREAGVPLEAVLRGIDDAFDKHDASKQRGRGRARRINGLAWAAQAVLAATEAAVDAATGSPARIVAPAERESGFEIEAVAAYLERNADTLATLSVGQQASSRLRQLAVEVRGGQAMNLEDLDRTLLVLEEKIYLQLLAEAPEEALTSLREQAARELAPYKGRMQAVQIRQVEQQFLQKRLLEWRGAPRLSLFYMQHG